MRAYTVVTIPRDDALSIKEAADELGYSYHTFYMDQKWRRFFLRDECGQLYILPETLPAMRVLAYKCNVRHHKKIGCSKAV